LRPCERGPYVVVRDDPVPLEYADRLVAGDPHRDRLIYASRYEIADGGAAEIIEEQARLLRRGARLVPRAAEITNRSPVVVEHIPRFAAGRRRSCRQFIGTS